ncbi:helix-turn-helix transcriptional regulator [Rodentibacter pneumotropicus]|uniref:XRE family transcriptional regulator n=1 Tax=Rodentibacter pneumotropicus TaxID=758 RepID=A0A4S2QL11_9PAST|nr:helix-turn-helix transcriptional regulator [Rodentibacter pneumotropicus]THA09408.1 XRE family transcriptional regulator [Rodentibacter pneumotropicus]THA18028.1 XRE family transcriptional regulator [Rodentibacter pneumotropicus]
MKNNIKKLRQRSKLSQAQLGKLLGVSQVSVGLYERGIREPSLLTIKNMTKALNCTPTELFPVLDVKHNG